ncbi:FG-nucleoporin NUP57 KNAG_0A07780 [Huiozyma naganishii CBS 8797]|uniref:Nucleoporin Nup54 alpha-helical domain-containing protein n=1 Tax=Huiozyma naganishii (strain ATCC MYA-139 / BCRC 22969 / CBS 8797 / KCTC 17520 / NBRC 10181 / NCYC 3082 / Yp74L-3) TaxID=1071383 RepID=J7R0U4_HUIN7|nr:hypothetical protein KNAG_0A07780 [Kazachstania naganishii CBS 8797]CCK68430.1 hypothetical protein KNAG_0A07780 [Kazachstania naganishii CBS 8797]
MPYHSPRRGTLRSTANFFKSIPKKSVRPLKRCMFAGGVLDLVPVVSWRGQLTAHMFGSNNAGNTGSTGFSFGNKSNSAGGGLFGNNANQQTGGGGLLGASKPAFGTNAPSQSGGMFGQNQQQQSGGLFGQSQQPQTQQSGGLFGQNQQQQPGQQSGGLFGQSQQQPGQQPGGLFGQSQQQQPGQQSGGLFGQSQQPQTQQSGGLFGQNQQQQPGQQSGGLFGQNQQQQQQSGGLFGANKPATGGGLFGQQAGSAPGGGLFGAKQPATNTAGGLFGNSNTTQPASGTGGLFGAKPAGTTTGLFGQNQNQNSAGGGLFGNNITGNKTGGLFGQQQQQQQQQPQSTLGNPAIPSSQPSFAWSQNTNQQQPNGSQTSTLFPTQSSMAPYGAGTATNNMPMNNYNNSLYALQQQQHSANYPQQIQEQIIKCKESWDPLSFKSKLRTFVYNKVNETDAIVYNNKPPNVIQEEWDQAIENKPKPISNLIPIQIFGFEELNQRNQLQIENVAKIRMILKDMLDKNTQLQQRHELETASRILKVVSKNVEIERRILKLGSQLSILKNRGLPMTINEEKMWTQFKSLLDRSQDPAGLGKTNELWARLTVLKERAKNISQQLDNTMVIINENGGSDSNTDGKASGEVYDAGNQKIDKIAHILNNQQRGICYLNSVLEKDHAKVDGMLKN